MPKLVLLKASMLEKESSGDSRSWRCIGLVESAITPPEERYLRSDSFSGSILGTFPFDSMGIQM